MVKWIAKALKQQAHFLTLSERKTVVDINIDIQHSKMFSMSHLKVVESPSTGQHHMVHMFLNIVSTLGQHYNFIVGP